jgi:hypothetical protein
MQIINAFFMVESSVTAISSRTVHHYIGTSAKEI